MMTRKHYIGLAKAIRDSGLSTANRVVVVRAINKVLKEDNPQYNEYAFRQMANAEEEVVL